MTATILGCYFYVIACSWARKVPWKVAVPDYPFAHCTEMSSSSVLSSSKVVYLGALADSSVSTISIKKRNELDNL